MGAWSAGGGGSVCAFATRERAAQAVIAMANPHRLIAVQVILRLPCLWSGTSEQIAERRAGHALRRRGWPHSGTHAIRASRRPSAPNKRRPSALLLPRSKRIVPASRSSSALDSASLSAADLAFARRCTVIETAHHIAWPGCATPSTALADPGRADRRHQVRSQPWRRDRATSLYQRALVPFRE